LNAREPGSILDGKYEIVQRLGGGGMGEVYLVRHVHLQELRVIKILRQDLEADPTAQKRFMREARLATQIKHPNVAIVYDFATLPDGSFYMVWEHIEGEDVGDRIRRQGPFLLPVAVRLGIQTLQGLEAVHSTGVIHRDLSPDNLMITEDKAGNLRLKIIDLGLARTLEAEPNLEITQVGMFMGKLQYCSPEQASPGGATLDHRSDIYSVGVVLYEMISGLPPFESENQHGFIFKRLSEDPLPLRGRNPRVEVPVELDRVVRRALERDRELRYPDARSFINALERVQHSLTAVETREILMNPYLTKTLPPSAAVPAMPTAAPPVARARSSSELSKMERLDLLAQIERASKRVQESSSELDRAAAVLAAGRLDEAQQLIERIEIAAPRTQGLDHLRDRLAQAREREGLARRSAETEQVLTGYLQRKQLPLARLALEALLELQPNHPKRADYEGWIGLVADETERAKRADAAQAEGRAALDRKDFPAARRALETIVQNDSEGRRAEAFVAELEHAERDFRENAESEARRRRFEELIAANRVVEAKEELDALAKLDVPRVTLDFLREQLAESRAGIHREEQEAVFERRYRQSTQDHDWATARDVAQEAGKVPSGRRRAEAMFAEIDRLEAIQHRQQAVEQGVRQVEAFIEQGEAAKAELALKILVQMDPENRHRKRLEKAVGGMRR
jgi:serine/threonine protein kinase